MNFKNLYIDHILNHMDITFYRGINTFITGTQASGKTTLLRCIANKIKYEGTITSTINYQVVLDEKFTCKTVEEEIKFASLTKQKQEFILKLISVEKLSLNPNKLTEEDKKIVQIVKYISKDFQMILLDNQLSFIEETKKQIILEYFKKNKIDMVIVSNDIEDALYCDYMVVLNQGSVAIEGKTMQVLQEEKLLKRLGIGLPFYVDLSIQLKLYGLIDKIYTNKKELVGALWK